MTLTTLQHLGQAFDAGDVDACATCGQIVCSHSDADYQGWAEPDAITPTTAAEIRRRRKVALRGVGSGVSVSHSGIDK